mgnify:FL=1
MNKMKKVFKVAIYELKLMCFSSKFLILSVLAFIIMDVTVRGYRMFSHDYTLPIAPAVLPFYFADVSYGNIEILFLLLWFSDVPMKQRVQNQILQRCGMPCFALGHLFSIVFATIVFVLEQFVFSVLLCGTNLTFTSWGKVWGSAAAGTVKKLGYSSGFVISKNVFQNYTVPQALLFSMTIFLLMGICYGMVEFLLNGLQKGKLGTVVLSVWSVAWIFLKTNTTDFIRSFMKYAPQGWYNLGRNNISASKNIISGLFVGVVVLFIVNFVLIMQKKLELVK